MPTIFSPTKEKKTSHIHSTCPVPLLILHITFILSQHNPLLHTTFNSKITKWPTLLWVEEKKWLLLIADDHQGSTQVPLNNFVGMSHTFTIYYSTQFQFQTFCMMDCKHSGVIILLPLLQHNKGSKNTSGFRDKQIHSLWLKLFDI
jgi:hypothetical protein